ncbi:MAG TPA: pyridoxal-dependent decarboxylase [Actinomycetota bacterium]|nr:pyridoxal-dependent decarboxylase [Actinomycetota bacterium]
MPEPSDLRPLLVRAAERAASFRTTVGERPVAPEVDVQRFRESFGGPLPDKGIDAQSVIDELVEMVEPALVASAGPRFFGFVMGGALDSATAADMLTTGWEQVGFNGVTSPASALVEEIVGTWLKDALGLPVGASFGIVTGAQGANTAALAAARHRVLERAGWDVERDGLQGAPKIRIIAGEERHGTIDRSLRLLGFGTGSLQTVPAGRNGAVDAEALVRALESGPGEPTIVCVQAGNVNTGAFDDLAAANEAAHRHGAWVHVDGAFGLWAAASPQFEHLVAGREGADSWAVDGHKWLQVPYDTGFVLCADPEAHSLSMSYTAAYLQDDRALRAPSDFVPESSRRSRGFASWAALRELGRAGLADLVERCCALAGRFAEQLGTVEGARVANEVVLNQVLVGFGDDERTDRVIANVQRDGTCWMGGTTWGGDRLMRISVSNWTTTEDDVDRSVEAIRRALAAA